MSEQPRKFWRGGNYWVRHDGEDKIAKYLTEGLEALPGEAVWYVTGREAPLATEELEEVGLFLGERAPVQGRWLSTPPLKAAVLWLVAESQRLRREGRSTEAEIYATAAAWLNGATGHHY